MRRLDIAVNSSFKHEIEIAIGLPIDAAKFRADAVTMVHRSGGPDAEASMPIEVTLLDATQGTVKIKRLGQYPAGGRFEIRVANDILLPEHRAIFGGVAFSAMGAGHI